MPALDRYFLRFFSTLFCVIAVEFVASQFCKSVAFRTKVLASDIADRAIVSVSRKTIASQTTQGRDQAFCNQIDSPETTTITLLVPAAANGSLTVSSHPTFAWFVQTQQPVSMIFLLSHPDQADPIYTENFQVNTSGIVRVSLPAEVALEPNVWYRWLVVARCANSADGEVYARSFIKRVETPALNLSSESHLQAAQVYAAAGIWHDALNELLKARQQDPNNPQLSIELRSLIQQVRPDDFPFNTLENLLN